MRTKKIWTISVIVAGFILAGLAVAADWVPPRNWGPFNCTDCKVAPYMPDTSTLAYLRDFKTSMDISGNRLFTNDTVTVCAGAYCTTYTLTDSGDFLGSGSKDNSSPGGGSGGGIGGGGGSEGDGGGFGGDTCSVVPGTSTGCSTVNGVSNCQTIDTGFMDCGFGH